MCSTFKASRRGRRPRPRRREPRAPGATHRVHREGPARLVAGDPRALSGWKGSMTPEDACGPRRSRRATTRAPPIWIPTAARRPPAEVTRFARSLGDKVTRLDRWELELNRPDGVKDTTSPRAMAHSVGGAVLLGEVLKPSSRAARAMDARRNPGRRPIRKTLPAAWGSADKPGTGNTQTNDAVLARPPNRAPPMVAAYYCIADGSSAAAQMLMQEIDAPLPTG